jgi:hypothetical protein
MAKFASCSSPTHESLGCPFFNPTPANKFTGCQLADRNGVPYRGRGPCNLVVKHRLPNGATAQHKATCYLWYYRYLGQYNARHITGQQFQIVALEGEQYEDRGTRKAHTMSEGRKEGCPDCLEGKYCARRVPFKELKILEAFVRPAERFGEVLSDPMPDNDPLPLAPAAVPKGARRGAGEP